MLYVNFNISYLNVFHYWYCFNYNIDELKLATVYQKDNQIPITQFFLYLPKTILI